MPTEENQDAYTSWRPFRINGALKYSFGETRSKVCYSPTRKQYYNNSIGFQLHAVMRPLKPQMAFTTFFETSFSEKIHSKVTYTVNDFSNVILGSGMSFQLGKVNLFGFVDNILGVTDLGGVNTISCNFGVNFVIQ